MKGEIICRRILNEAGEWEDAPVYCIDGKEVTEAEYREQFPEATEIGNIMTPPTGVWPMRSEALAVHPDQIAEAHQSARSRGVPTDFDATGRPIFNDRDHRRRYMKAYGYHDRDAGYGDAQSAPKRVRQRK